MIKNQYEQPYTIQPKMPHGRNYSMECYTVNPTEHKPINLKYIHTITNANYSKHPHKLPRIRTTRKNENSFTFVPEKIDCKNLFLTELRARKARLNLITPVKITNRATSNDSRTASNFAISNRKVLQGIIFGHREAQHISKNLRIILANHKDISNLTLNRVIQHEDHKEITPPRQRILPRLLPARIIDLPRNQPIQVEYNRRDNLNNVSNASTIISNSRDSHRHADDVNLSTEGD